MLTRLAITLAVLASLSQPAAAQDLFREQGKPALVARDIHLTLYGDYLGQDSDGWVYAADGGVCFHPDDPSKEYSPPQVFFAGGDASLRPEYAASILPDGSGVEIAYTMRYPSWMMFDLEALQVHRYRCPDLAPDGPGMTRLDHGIMQADHPLLKRGFGSPAFVRTSDGLCFADNPLQPMQGTLPEPGDTARVVCVDPGVSPAAVSLLVDAADLDEALKPSPGLLYMAADRTSQDMGWTLSGLAGAPGGRLFFFATRTYWYDGFSQSFQVSYRWIVERRADGTLAPRLGPFASDYVIGAWTPLMGAHTLVYHAALDAMLVWPVLGQEHNWWAAWNGDPGWTGIGFEVLPLDGPGHGYLPLARPFYQRNGCTDLAYCTGELSPFASKAVVQGDAIDLMVRVPDPNPNIPQFEIFRLSFDPATLDLDHDGLDATAEAAAGTSDTLPDSDFGGTPDAIEVAVTGTDPLDAAGEPAHRNTVKGWVRYVPSMLIQKLGGEGGVRSLGTDGPACVDGACYGPEGEVARYPASRALHGGAAATVARDGSFIMLETAAGLERFSFEDGSEELAIARADYENLIPCEPFALRIYPIDRERTWLACDGTPDAGGRYNHPARIAYADGGAPVVLYDHPKAQRDSGLTPAADEYFEPLDNGVMATILPIGWIEETGRFELAVRGNWETYLIALAPDGTATLIGRARGLKGMQTFDSPSYQVDLFPPAVPTSLVATGHGDYFADGAIMTPYNAFLPGYATWSGDPNKPVSGGWGDVLFDLGGELVRYERDVQPGDVLILQTERSLANYAGATLYKSGPRGGIVDLWGPERAIPNVAGMDLARDGSMRMCIADDVSDVVWELEPAGPGGPPELVRWTAEVPYVVDCAYDDDGTLRVLSLDHVSVRVGAFGALQETEDLAPAPEPIELVRDASGDNVVRTADGLRGKEWLADGREVTMNDDDFTLRIDGTEISAITNLIYQTATIPRDPKHAARVSFAERPDGMIVIAPHHAATLEPYATLSRILVYTPDGSFGAFLGHDEYVATDGLALAVVPGGSAADPWTGRLPAEPPEAPSIGLPEAPRVDPATDAAPPAEDEGCGGAGAPSLLGLALALAKMRLQQRTP